MGDLGDGVGVMDTHRLEERGGLRLGGVETQVEAAQHSQRAAKVTIRDEEQLWGISRGFTSNRLDEQTPAECHSKHATDLEPAAPGTNRRAKDCRLREAQQTTRGIRLSELRICRQNHHIGPYSSVVRDHRPLP